MLYILDQHSMEINDWENTDKKFTKTTAVDHILDVLITNDVITIVGSSGIGKSVTLQHAALHLRDIYGYQIIPCRNTSDIQLHVRQNVKYVLVIDDFCGKYVSVQAEIDEWYKYQSFLTKLLSARKIKVLTSCRKSVFNDCKFQLLKVFCKHICDLSLGDYALTSPEKSKIALMYIPLDTVNIIEKDVDKFDCFPLMCYLFTTRPISNPLYFFGNTFAIYEEELDYLNADTDKTKLCALFICVLFNGCLEESLLTEEHKRFVIESNDGYSQCILPDEIIENSKLSGRSLLDIFDACGVDLNTPRSRIHKQLDLLVDTYLTKKDNNYVFIHDKLYDYMCFYFGNCLQCSILKHAESVLIRDRCRLNSIETDTEAFAIIIHNANEERYFERIVDDIFAGDIFDVFYNNQMKYQTYRTRLMKYMSNAELNLEKLFAVRADSVDRLDRVTFLYLACLEGYTDIVNFILDKGYNQVDNDYNPLNAASYSGHKDILELLIQKGADINHRDSSGQTPLVMACIGKRKDIVRWLIEIGADVDKRTCEGPTPLMWACSSGYRGMADMLLYKGANIDKADYEGRTPVMWCRKQGESGIFDLLIYKGANLNKRDNSGWSPLMWATYYGLLSTVEVLFAKNADINESDDFGMTPLMIACDKGFNEIILFLIRKRVNINSKNKLGQTALMLSCASNNFEILNILIENNAKINAVDILDETSLMKVCSLGLLRNTEFLLQKRADVNISDKDGNTPLSVACFGRHDDLVKVLIKYGANVNQIDSNGSTILINSINGALNEYLTKTENGIYANMSQGNRVIPDLNHIQLSVIDILLKNGTSVDKTDIKGWSPLMWACYTKNTSVISLLIDNGANVNSISVHDNTTFRDVFKTKDVNTLSFLLIKDVSRKKVLIEAIRSRNLETVVCIIESTMQNSITHNDEKRVVPVDQIMKYDINWINGDGFSPLALSYKYGCLDIAQYLVSHGADISTPDNDGFTSLYYCCKNGYKEGIRFLVSNGANIDSFSPDNWNPLTYSCFKGHYAIVELLLNLKANVHVEDRLKRSPLRLACLRKHTTVAQILIEKGADAYKELVYAYENKERSIVDFVIQTHPSVHKLLLMACKRNNLVLTHLLIEKLEDLPNGIDQTACVQSLINCIDPVKILKIACKAGKLNLLKAAFDSGMGNDITFENKTSPLMLVSYSGNASSAMELIERGADINQLDSNGWNSLRWACQGGNMEVISLLIRKGADFENYLLNACKDDDAEVITLLTKQGANLNKTLIFACKDNQYTSIDSLLAKGAEINYEDDNRWTPLMWACYNGHTGTVDVLKHRGSQLNKDLLSASSLDDDRLFERLVNAGANIDETFIMACKLNDKNVKYFIEKGVDINICLNNNYPLVIASQNKYENLFSLLIENGVNTDEPFTFLLEEDGITIQSFLQTLNNLSMDVFTKCFRDQRRTERILIEATKNGFEKIVARVMDNGLNQEVIESVFVVACKNKIDTISTLLINKGAKTWELFKLGFKTEDLDIIKSLVNAGTSLNDTDQLDWSALSWACFYRHEHIICNRKDLKNIEGIIDYLIEKGADVNYALALACIERHFTAVEFLINKGGDPNLKDIRGHSLLKKAEKQGYHDIANVLRSHGATRKSKCVTQ